MRDIVIFLIFLILFSSNLFGEKVRYVIDGDTIILGNNERVRLLGINAPEMRHGDKRGQFYGEEAKHFLGELIKGKEVKLKDEPLQPEFDQFGRKLAYVYLPDGTFVNELLVKEGYAEVFRKYDFKYRDEFLKYEEDARNKKLGIWSKPGEIWKKFWLDFLEELQKFLRRLK